MTLRHELHRMVTPASECPYLSRGDARCEERFQVARLDEFFALCCGNYRRCATYHRVRSDDARATAPARPAVSEPTPVALTAHGRELRVRALLS